MAGEPSTFANRWKRFSDWDERPLRLDKFAIEDAENGFASFTSRHDPQSGLTLGSGGIDVMDGVGVGDFDMIDTFIARYHIDPEIAPEAMILPSNEVARMLVDMNVPRSELVRLARGTADPYHVAVAIRVESQHVFAGPVVHGVAHHGPMERKHRGHPVHGQLVERTPGPP